MHHTTSPLLSPHTSPEPLPRTDHYAMISPHLPPLRPPKAGGVPWAALIEKGARPRLYSPLPPVRAWELSLFK